MGRRHYDEETNIETRYYFYVEGIRVKLNDSCCPGGNISFYKQSSWVSGGRELLYTKVDCPKELLWTAPILESLCEGVEMEHRVNGYTCYETLATRREADEIATRVEYDAQGEAHIAVTHTLSIGTSTVWLKVTRHRSYWPSFDVDVRLCVEFANSEDCTRFIHEDMRKLEGRRININDCGSDVGVIDDIIRALSPLDDDHRSARRNAARRGIPFSQFDDEYPQPETQVIRRRGSNRGDDRPCFLTLHLSTGDFWRIFRVDWSATTIPPTFPSPSGAFRSLSNLHLKFSSPASQDRNHGSSSRSHLDDLTISISATEISFSAETDSVSLGKGFTLSSKHRTININYINAIMGDAFLGPISRSNIGGTNNVNNIRTSSPVGSRSPRLTWSLPRPHRSTPLLQEQPESQGGVGRWVQPRPSRPRPY